jgi:hypothetical protein
MLGRMADLLDIPRMARLFVVAVVQRSIRPSRARQCQCGRSTRALVTVRLVAESPSAHAKAAAGLYPFGAMSSVMRCRRIFRDASRIESPSPCVYALCAGFPVRANDDKSGAVPA